MNRNAVLVTLLVVVLIVISSSVVISNNNSNTASVIDSIKSFFGVKSTGNGAPSGGHYNLNIIGTNDKTADMTDSSGRVIFVKLDGKSKINLAEGPEFQVLDKNGTDGNGATFQLPNPDPDNDGVTLYSVYARAGGKQGGSAKMNTCATSPGLDGVLGTADDETICSLATLAVERTKGKQTFENVSAELLYIYYDLDGDGIAERYNIFNDALQGYFWDYDNNKLRLLQLRFYEIQTTVPATY